MNKVDNIKKITMSQIGAQPPKTGADKRNFMERLENEGTVFVADLFGQVTSLRNGKTDFGEYIKFGGAHKAVNLATGETFKAPSLILPAFLQDQLAAAFQTQESMIEYAIRVGVKHRPDLTIGYEYVAQELIESSEADTLTELEGRVRKAAALLPAPDAEDAPARPAAKKKAK